MTSLAIAAVLQTAILAAEPQDAATEAYNRSMQSGRPLVLLFGADWCPACNVMKDQILPKVRQRGGMRGVEFAYVDVDDNPKLAKRLLRGGSIPQLVRFDRQGDEWTPKYMIGAQKPEKVIEFLATSPAPGKPRYSSYERAAR
jgi:thiol-disulfide isomerase/thioredoxin